MLVKTREAQAFVEKLDGMMCPGEPDELSAGDEINFIMLLRVFERDEVLRLLISALLRRLYFVRKMPGEKRQEELLRLAGQLEDFNESFNPLERIREGG